MKSMRQEHQRKKNHLHINEGLSGKMLEINDHESRVQLVTNAEMVVDETGLF